MNNGVSVLNDSRNQSNPIKDRIVQSFNEEPQTTLYQIDHTNVHSDEVRHTDTHTGQKTDNGYINYHTNNTPPHVDTHSNVGLFSLCQIPESGTSHFTKIVCLGGQTWYTTDKRFKSSYSA